MEAPPFQTTFAVVLTCDACIEDVTNSLHKVDGVGKVVASLGQQLVTIEGTAAPSALLAAIQATGRDGILRGSGEADRAAVAILETHSTTVQNNVRGLARMVQVSPTLTLVDLSINGLSPGTYWATIRESGDISRGAASTGGIWNRLGSPSGPDDACRGFAEQVEVGEDGRGSAFVGQAFPIWEVFARSMVVSRQVEHESWKQDDADTLVGVIARSAGVWENDKTVCSCSGKTLWEERRENVDKGML
ncbi:MAG: copper chaperone [Thelocarpon impressellum]|nr:MAG: copper chaperone [Thelocarpon impressellum]